MKKIFTFITLACMALAVHAEKNEQFKFIVTGYQLDKTTPVQIANTVYSDFSFDLVLPAKGTQISPEKFSVECDLINIDAFGTGTHKATKTFETNVKAEGYTTTFSEQLKNIYAFNVDGEKETCKCLVTIADIDKSKADNKDFNYTYDKDKGVQLDGVPENKSKGFYYNLKGSYATKIEGIVSDEASSSAAWNFLLNSDHVTCSDATGNDIFVKIPADSYIIIGDEKLVYTKDFEFMHGKKVFTKDNFSLVEEASEIVSSGKKNADTYLAEIELKAGAQLAWGSKILTLNVPCHIYIDARGAWDEDSSAPITGQLTEFRKVLDKENSDIISAVLKDMDNFCNYAIAAGKNEKYPAVVVVEFEALTPSAINSVAVANDTEAIYSANGTQLKGMQKGLNIVKKNGIVRKVMVK